MLPKDMHAFICGMHRVRKINENMFIMAKRQFRYPEPSQTWQDYIKKSDDVIPKRLRDEFLKDETAIVTCSHDLVRSYVVALKHVNDDVRTKQIQSLIVNGTSDTIHKVLMDENPDNLLREQDINCVNYLAEAAKMPTVPWINLYTLRESKIQYVIPLIKDLKKC